MTTEQTRHYYWTTTTTTTRRCDKRKLDSWEGQQGFAGDDTAVERDLGGCVWPPRSYSCNFCGREFMSAQALGGHMNVHRRERARLKNRSSSRSPFSDDDNDDVNNEKKKKKNSNLMFGCNKTGNEKVCLVDRCHVRRPLQQPADGIMEELDLELRLGINPPKVK